MGRLSVGVAPCSRRPLDAGRCCGLRGCNIRPPSIHPHLAIKMPHKLFVLCASGQVLPSMVLLGRARALRACDATTHPCAWVAWCVRALGFCPGAASLEGLKGCLQGTKPGNSNSNPPTHPTSCHASRFLFSPIPSLSTRAPPPTRPASLIPRPRPVR